MKVKRIKVRKTVIQEVEPPEPKPKTRKVRRVRKVKTRTVKPKVTPKTDDTNPLNLDPFMLDPARVFHYGKALVWLNQMGVRQVGIERDWTLTIHTNSGRVVKIPPLVMVTRDRRYAMEHIQNVINDNDQDEVTFHVDTYDREFHGLVEVWNESA